MDNAAVLEEALKHQGLVRKRVRRFVHNPDDADDILQATYLKIWRNAERFDQSRPIEAWISSIANRLAIDSVKYPKPVSHPLPYNFASRDASPIEYAIQAEMAERVQQAVEKLPETYRTAIELRFFQGMTYSEGARKLNLNLHSFVSRVYAALAYLQRFSHLRETLL